MSWRDVHFDEQMKHWETFMRYWLENDTLREDSRHVIVHETLVDEKTGPDETAELVQFLQRVSDLPTEIPMADIPCFWRRVVNFQLHTPARRRLRQSSSSSSLSTPKIAIPSNAPYTYIQLDKAAGIITQMIGDYSHDKKVLEALMRYIIYLHWRKCMHSRVTIPSSSQTTMEHAWLQLHNMKGWSHCIKFRTLGQDQKCHEISLRQSRVSRQQ